MRQTYPKKNPDMHQKPVTGKIRKIIQKYTKNTKHMPTKTKNNTSKRCETNCKTTQNHPNIYQKIPKLVRTKKLKQYIQHTQRN